MRAANAVRGSRRQPQFTSGGQTVSVAPSVVLVVPNSVMCKEEVACTRCSSLTKQEPESLGKATSGRATGLAAFGVSRRAPPMAAGRR